MREACKANLDVQVPITWQPEDKLQAIINTCVEQFPGYCSQGLARKRILLFLKNCRKTVKRKEERAVAGRSRESTPKKAKQEKVEALPLSPWAVVSLRVFLFYNCPACDFKCKKASGFFFWTQLAPFA